MRPRLLDATAALCLASVAAADIRAAAQEPATTPKTVDANARMALGQE